MVYDMFLVTVVLSAVTYLYVR